MVDLATAVPSLIGGGGLVWFGNLALTWIKSRDGRAEARIAADAEMEKHRDSLTFDLLSAARAELGAMRQELEKLRPMEAHLYQLEQALAHLESLLNAKPEERPSVERSARAFVNRMRRTAEAAGTLANEAQRLASELDVAEHETRKGGGK